MRSNYSLNTPIVYRGGIKPQRGENFKDHTRGRGQILAGLAPQKGQWAECAGKKPPQKYISFMI